MATEIWCELVCAKCAHTFPGEYVDTASMQPIRARFKRDAREKGWVFQGREAFCCEIHRVQYRMENPE